MSKRKNINKEYKKQKRNSLFKTKKEKVEQYMLDHNLAPDISSVNNHIAFVIDGEVVEIIHCQEKMAAILLSSPEIVKINEGVFPKIGWEYKDNLFSERSF